MIGGTALTLLQLTERATEDVDVTAFVQGGALCRSSPLPASLREMSNALAAKHELKPGWLDVKSTALLDLPLPDGLLQRCSVRDYGALKIHLPARRDLIALKLYAAASSNTPFTQHYQDLRRLTVDGEGVGFARGWCLEVAPQLEARVHEVLEDLRKELRQ